MHEEKKRVGVGFGVILLKNGVVLLGRRHADPSKAGSELHGEGTWTLPGGKLEFGETFEEGAKREVAEETGMRLGAVKVICVNNDRVEDAHFVTIGMLADNFEGKPRVMEPDEITEWQWFSLNGLPQPLFFPSRKVLANFSNKSFYLPS